jgi:hypothetical protein
MMVTWSMSDPDCTQHQQHAAHNLLALVQYSGLHCARSFLHAIRRSRYHATHTYHVPYIGWSANNALRNTLYMYQCPEIVAQCLISQRLAQVYTDQCCLLNMVAMPVIICYKFVMLWDACMH